MTIKQKITLTILERVLKLRIHKLFSGPGNGSANTSEYDYYYDYYSDYFGIENYAEKKVANAIFIYISPILLLMGTFGNLMSAIVLNKLSNKVGFYCSQILYPLHIHILPP